MPSHSLLMTTRSWGLPDAQTYAAVILEHPQQAKTTDTRTPHRNEEIRKRAADVARRITKKKVDILAAMRRDIRSFSESIVSTTTGEHARIWDLLLHASQYSASAAPHCWLLRPFAQRSGNGSAARLLKDWASCQKANRPCKLKSRVVLEERS